MDLSELMSWLPYLKAMHSATLAVAIKLVGKFLSLPRETIQFCIFKNNRTRKYNRGPWH